MDKEWRDPGCRGWIWHHQSFLPVQWGQFCAAQPEKDLKVLESVQRRDMKMGEGMEVPDKEQLKALGLFSSEKGRLRVELIPAHSFLPSGRSDLCAL